MAISLTDAQVKGVIALVSSGNHSIVFSSTSGYVGGVFSGTVQTSSSGFIGGAYSGTLYTATSGFQGGVVSGYALSGGSSHVGGMWPMQAGFWSGTTDANGQAAITFPYLFANAPTSVVATVEGYDYFCRIVSGTRAVSGFTVRVLQPATSGATALAVVSGVITSLSHVPAGNSTVNTIHSETLYAATASGGTAGQSFAAPGGGGTNANITLPVLGVGAGDSWTDNAVVSAFSGNTNSFQLSGSLPSVFAPVASGNVNIDWMAAA